MNKTNATKKTFALRGTETLERERFFGSIWRIDTLKNVIDKIK